MPLHPLRLTTCLAMTVAIATTPVLAADEREADSTAGTGIFSLIPPDSMTEHVLGTPDGALSFTATAGTLDLYNPGGTRTAKVFYTSYVAKDAAAPRPLTFVFNGGPGAASAYLHLGFVGPKILDFKQGGTRPELEENPDSWLAFTDLVLVDPVGTGWSRAADDGAARRFYGVDADASTLAKVIALYAQKNDRLSSPVYLLGESYGGFRAAKVASALKREQGILVSGILMVSPMIDGRFLPDGGIDPLEAAAQLPSLAAAEMERKGRFDPDAMAAVERFAMTDYLVSLAGPPPEGEEADRLYGRIADLTGLAKEDVAATRGFVADIYSKRAGGAGKVVSRYDAGHAAPDAYPEFPGDHNDDPVLDGFTRAYGPALASYARHDLGFATEMTYTLLNTEVNRRWDWEGTRADADASGDLRDLLSVIPTFRLAVFHGYSDILTPYGASRFVLDHLPEDLSRGRTELLLHRGGHMFYTDPASRRAATADARRFYEKAETN